MYAATRGPNVKWGGQILTEGPGTTGPQLAMALGSTLKHGGVPVMHISNLKKTKLY